MQSGCKAIRLDDLTDCSMALWNKNKHVSMIASQHAGMKANTKEWLPDVLL